MFVSVANADKRSMVFPVKRLADLGFRIVATEGTAEMLQRNGMDVEVVSKYFEGDGSDDGTVVELIRSGEIDLVINTPYGQSGPRVDGYEIRTAAVAADIPCITTVAGAAAAIQGIEALTRSDVGRGAAAGAAGPAAPGPSGSGALTGMWHRQGEGGLVSRIGGEAYRHVARPVLFRMGKGDAETAHHRTLSTLATVAGSRSALSVLARMSGPRGAPRRVFGVDFPSPVGLAAGMDKDGVALKAWPALGFGFVEVGTVTAHGQPGNPRPRLFRLTESESIINRMGFNNAGAAALAARLADVGDIGVPLGISLGKSKVTPVEAAVGDYLTSLRAVYPYADYLAVNVSSPNTPGLRGLQDRGPLDELLGALTEEAGCLAGQHDRPVPVLVKIAPDLSDGALGELLEVCVGPGIAGVIATNTTVERHGRHAARDRAGRRGRRAVRSAAGAARAGGGAVRRRRTAICR